MTPEEDEQSGCKLLDSFAIFVQLVLATLAFSTLIIKRQRELPQRPLLIWYAYTYNCTLTLVYSNNITV